MSAQDTYRYPGSRPFQDTPRDRKLFWGRAEESHELLHLTLAERLVVLFANSGLGKSSLINAGVLEPLRKRDFFPMTVRVNDPENGPVHTVYKDIEEAVRQAGVELLTLEEGRLETEFGLSCQGQPLAPGELSRICVENRVPLWLFFKETEFWRGDVLCDPVLVMDQFEELFSLQAPEKREAFVEELAHLVRDRLDDADAPAHEAGLKGPSLKILLSLREDWLGSLEELVPKIPNILSTRFRLGPLKKDQAREAIEKPASMDADEIDGETFGYEPEAVDAILDFLAQRRLHGEMVASEDITPSQLQIICHHLEEITRRPGHGPTVTLADLGGDPRKVPQVLAGVLEKYYDEQTTKVARGSRLRAVRRLCEDGLIVNGRRASSDGAILQGRFGVTSEELSRLTDCHLLRAVPRLDSVYYEIAHDTLVEPILASRGKRRQRRQRVLGAALSVMLVIVAGTSAWAAYGMSFDAKRGKILTQLRDLTSDTDPLGYLLSALESAHGAKCLEGTPDAACEEFRETLGEAVGIAREIGPREVNVDDRTDPTLAIAATAAGRRQARAESSELVVSDGLTPVQTLRVPFDELTAVAVAADGRRVATAGEDGTVRIWRRDGDQLQPYERKSRPWEAHSKKILAMAAHPTNDLFLTSGGEGGLALWSFDGEARAHAALDDESIDDLKINAIAWSPGGERFAVGGKDGVARVWSESEGWRSYERHSQGVRAVAFDPEGRWLASVGDDAALRVWDTRRGEGHRHFLVPEEDNQLKAVAWSPDGRWIVAGGTGKNLMRWSLDGERKTVGAHDGHVLTMAFRDDGILASGGRDGVVRFWDVDDRREVAQVDDFKRYVNAVDVAGDGTLVAGSYGGSVAVLAWPLARDARPYGVSQHDLTAVALDASGRKLATGSSDGTLRLMEWSSIEDEKGFMRLLAPIRGSWDRMEALAFDAGGERVAAATSDGHLRLWRLDGTPLLDVPTGRQDEVVAIDFVDADTLTTRDASGDRRFWDVGLHGDGRAFHEIACARLATFRDAGATSRHPERIEPVLDAVCEVQ